jgi:hypothetical protein
MEVSFFFFFFYPSAFFPTHEPWDFHGLEGLDRNHIAVVVAKADNNGWDSRKE